MNEQLPAQRVVFCKCSLASESFHSYVLETGTSHLDTVALYPHSRHVNWMGVPQIRNEEYIIAAQRVSPSITPSLVILI